MEAEFIHRTVFDCQAAMSLLWSHSKHVLYLAKLAGTAAL